MAEQPIDKNGLIKSGAIDSIINEFEKWKIKLQEIDVIIDKLGKATPILQPPKNTEDLNKLLAKIQSLEDALKKKSETETKLSAIEKERLKLTKQTEAAEAKKIIALNKENKELLELRAETNKLNREQRDSIKASERQSNAYFKLSDATRDYKQQSKELGAELLVMSKNVNRNEKEYQDLRKEYARVTKQAQLGDAQLKKLDDTVGDSQRKVGAYENALKGVSGALGTLGIALGVGGIATGLFNLNAELSKAVNQSRFFFNESEEGLTNIAKQASILGKVYNKEVNEVLISANALSKEFGVTGSEALTLLEKGFEKGGDTSGKLLDNISEYSTQLRLAGLNAEQSIAIITESQREGVFSDKGIDAIKEATISLREMTPATTEAIQAIGLSAEQIEKDIASGAKSYFDVIQEISERTNEFGEESKEAGVILADVFRGAGEDAGRFIFGLSDINTNLEELEDQSKGLDGAVKELTKSFFDFIYNSTEAQTVTNILSNTLTFVAENLTTILGVLVRVGAYLLIYSQRARIASVTTALFNKQNLLAIKMLPQFIRGLKLTSLSFRGLGTAMKSIPFVAIVAGLIELISYIYSASDATETFEDADKKANDEIERGNKLRIDRANLGKNLETQLKNINNLSQAELKILKQNVEARKSQAEANVLSLKTAQDRLKVDKEDFDNMKAGTTTVDGFRENMFKLTDSKKNYNDEINKGVFALEEEQRILKQSEEQLILINGLIKDRPKPPKPSPTEDLSKELEKQKKLYNDILDLQDSLWFRNLGDEDQEVVKRLQQLDDELATLDADTLLREQDREELRKQLIDDSEKDILAIRKKYISEIEKAELEAIAKEKEEQSKRVEGLEEQARLANEVRKNEILTTEQDQEKSQEALKDSEIKFLEELIQIRQSAGLETIELENQLLELRKKINEESFKSVLNSVSSSVTLLKDLYSDEIDFAISKQNDLIANSQKTIDNIQAAAAAGTSQAEGSILAQEKAIEKAQDRIEKANRRKARLELISSGINTFNSAVSSGQTGIQALSTTAASMTGLMAFLSALPSFAVGTNYLDFSGRGIDGQGGRPIIAHDKERIVDAKNNKLIGFSTTNDELAKVANYYNKGLLKPIGEVTPMIMQSDNSEILRSIKDGFGQINNWNMEVEELFGIVSFMVEKSKGGDIHKFSKKFKA